MTGCADGWGRRAGAQLLEQPEVSGVLISASKDPDAKLTFVVTSDQAHPSHRLAVKIPATVAAGDAVDHEGRMLVEIRRTGLGTLGSTVPRYVESLTVDGRPVLVSTAVPGTPMSVRYHTWSHTARPSAVRADFDVALGWLEAFQATTQRQDAPLDWAGEVLDAVRGRWDGHRDLPAALARLESAADHLQGALCPVSAVHGDFWFGNVLLDEHGAVSGVVDWENAACRGTPLRDVARFVLSYALYLDRHTRAGRCVMGHPHLSRIGFAPGIGYALCDSGWFPRLVQEALGRALGRLGLSPRLWYDVALTGIGEVAASANSDEFGAGHLALLGSLPVRSRRHRSARR